MDGVVNEFPVPIKLPDVPASNQVICWDDEAVSVSVPVPHRLELVAVGADGVELMTACTGVLLLLQAFPASA